MSTSSTFLPSPSKAGSFFNMGRIAFISDIHGNWEALGKTLERLETLGVEEIHCLGDVVGYGPDPEVCIEEVRRKCSIVVAGNHDWAVADKTPLEEFNAVARAAVYWTKRRLSPAHREYLASLPLTASTATAFLVHSSPLHPQQWLYIMDAFSASMAFERCQERLILVGHTHIPQAFRLRGREVEPLSFPFVMEGDRYLVNVGSVGQPRDGDPRACCVIVEGDRVSLERIPYPAHLTAQKIKERGLPHLLAIRIQEGW